MSKKEIERDPNQKPVPGIFESAPLKILQAPKDSIIEQPKTSAFIASNVIPFKSREVEQDEEERPLSAYEEQGYTR